MRRPLNELILTPLLAEVRMTEAIMNVTRFGSADLLPKRNALSIRSARKRPFRTIPSCRETLYFTQMI